MVLEIKQWLLRMEQDKIMKMESKDLDDQRTSNIEQLRADWKREITPTRKGREKWPKVWNTASLNSVFFLLDWLPKQG